MRKLDSARSREANRSPSGAARARANTARDRAPPPVDPPPPHRCATDACYAGDAAATVAYGFDSTKLDGCGAEKDLFKFYGLFNASGKQIMIEVRACPLVGLTNAAASVPARQSSQRARPPLPLSHNFTLPCPSNIILFAPFFLPHIRSVAELPLGQRHARVPARQQPGELPVRGRRRSLTRGAFTARPPECVSVLPPPSAATTTTARPATCPRPSTAC